MSVTSSQTIETADASSPMSSPILRQRRQQPPTPHIQPHDGHHDCHCDTATTPIASTAASAFTPPPSPSLTSTIKACTAQLAYDLLPYDKLPRWLQDNPYIASGYRVEIGWKNSCHSLCHLHNETMNIWTHFIACAVMLVLLVITIWGMSPHGVDRLNLNVIDLSRLRGVQTTQPTELLCPLSPGSADAVSSSIGSAFDGNCSVDEPYIAAHHSFMSSLEQLFHSPSSYLPQPVTDVYDRLQHHLPNLQHLTRTLRQQATSITQLLPSSPQAKFLSFLNRVEEHLSSLHATVTDAVSMESVARLKALMVENVGGFSPYVTMQRQVDMVRVVRAMMAQFVKTLTEEEGLLESNAHNEQPTLEGVFEDDEDDATTVDGIEQPSSTHQVGQWQDEEHIGLALRIKRWAGLGEGDIFFAYSSDDDRILPPPSFKQIHHSLQHEERLRRHAWEEDVQLHFYLPRWPLTVFMLSALCCLFFSAWFHCFQAVSAQMTVVFQCLDYAGITLLIAGSNVPVIYYGFYCFPKLSALYNSIISTLAGITFLITILPHFREMRFRALKTYLFISLGFAGVVPLVHLVYHMGYIHFIVWYLAAMGAFYVMGAMVYLFQIPERWWPGKFDLWFSSHQIWHLLIVAAVLTHYLGVIHMYEWRMTRVCPA